MLKRFMLLDFLQQKNIEKKLHVLAPLFIQKESVLDFGCGDLSLAEALKNANPSLSITGVDVVDLDRKVKDITFVHYDGTRLPFQDKSFDTILAFYVLHHCQDVKESLRECIRVAKKRIILVESIVRHPIELPFMRFVDWLFNAVKPLTVSHMTDEFHTLEEWQKIFRRCHADVLLEKNITVIPQPRFLPLGQSYLFELSVR